MRQWIQEVAFHKLTTNKLRWLFRGLVVVTILDWLMPDPLPLADEIALPWLTFEAWLALRGRKGATRDVKAEDVETDV